MRINNGYDGHNVLAPTRYYAHPFYSVRIICLVMGSRIILLLRRKVLRICLIGVIYRRMMLSAFNALCI